MISIETIRQAVVFAKKRVPVIAGCGSNDTNHGIKLAKECEKLGADGLLLVTPYYNKCTQKGLIKHYEAFAAATNVPIMLYSVQSRTGVNIEPSTVAHLAKIDNIVAIKEASGNIDQITKIASICGDIIDIYSGNDNEVVPVLALGAKGVVSVAGNILPKQMHDMVMEFRNGNINKSLELQLKLIPIIEALFKEVNPIPVKAAVSLMGFDSGQCRPPLYDPEESTLENLKLEMKKLNLL